MRHAKLPTKLESDSSAQYAKSEIAAMFEKATSIDSPARKAARDRFETISPKDAVKKSQGTRTSGSMLQTIPTVEVMATIVRLPT